MDNRKELEKLKGAKLTDIKDLLPTFYFDNKATLFVECHWRLVLNNEEIIVGDPEFKNPSTHEEGMGILRHEIMNKKVVDFEINDGLKDLRVTFENNLRLDIFVHSALYESWNLHIGERNFIGTPGGQVSAF